MYEEKNAHARPLSLKKEVCTLKGFVYTQTKSCDHEIYGLLSIMQRSYHEK